MARIRTIKPEFYTSPQVARCSPNARLLFIGLWTFADDAGVHPDDSCRLKMEVFPADSFAIADVDRMLQELIDAKLVGRFTFGGVEFLFVPSWSRHQRIDKPTFRYPKPPAEFDESSSNPRRVVVESSTTDWNGLESNGLEGNGEDKEPPNPLAGGTGSPDVSPKGSASKATKRPARTSTTKQEPFDPSLAPIPAELRTPAFLDAWRDWIAARLEKRKPLTKRAADEQLKQLAEVGPDAAVKAIRKSIASDWQGVFPESAGTRRNDNRQPMAGIAAWLEGSGEHDAP